MINLEKSYKTTEFQKSEYSYFDFECESCGHRYYSSKLNLSVFLYGIAILTGPNCSFVGFTCLSCLKTNLLKSVNLERLKQDLGFFMGPNMIEVFPHLKYHSPVPFPPEQMQELKDFNIIPWEYPLCGDGHINFHDNLNSYLTENPGVEEEYLCSYMNDGELPIGILATVLWFKPEQIEALVEIENDNHIRVFPRYIHKMSWYERYDSFCWRYKLYQDYLAELKMAASENFNQLREIARQKNVNLDNLTDANPGLINSAVIENLETQAQQSAGNDVTAGAEFLDLLLNFDPDPWDVPSKLSDLYKNMWKSVRPFRGGFDQVTTEGFDSGKFKPKITDAQVNEMADEIRHQITKSHVQQWAYDSHLDFIKDYTSLAYGLDFSYGYVWELKCRYLQRLHKILDNVYIRDAQYALYQTGPTWTLIFDGNEIVGLEQFGFKYINFLIQHPNQSFPTRDMDSLLDSPESVQDKNAFDVLSVEGREHFIDSSSAKTSRTNLSKEDEERYRKEMEDLKEYRQIIRKHEEMEEEELGSSNIDPELLKESKKAVSRFLKDYESKLKYGGVVYEKKEMIKKQQQRISKSIERAVKEINKYDTAAVEHFMAALSPINSKNQGYGTSKNIKWETK
jgi:hypothetical protein